MRHRRKCRPLYTLIFEHFKREILNVGKALKKYLKEQNLFHVTITMSQKVFLDAF